MEGYNFVSYGELCQRKCGEEGICLIWGDIVRNFQLVQRPDKLHDMILNLSHWIGRERVACKTASVHKNEVAEIKAIINMANIVTDAEDQ